MPTPNDFFDEIPEDPLVGELEEEEEPEPEPDPEPEEEPAPVPEPDDEPEPVPETETEEELEIGDDVEEDKREKEAARDKRMSRFMARRYKG